MNRYRGGIELLLQIISVDERVQGILRAVGLKCATALLQCQPGRTAIGCRIPVERRASGIADQYRFCYPVALRNSAKIKRRGIDGQARRLCQQGERHIRAARTGILLRVQYIPPPGPVRLCDYILVKGTCQANCNCSTGILHLPVIQHTGQVCRSSMRVRARHRARLGLYDRQAIIKGESDGASGYKTASVQLQDAAD